ncbi:MAG: ATP-dependent Clp protease ATP-binding subunit ClpA [Myxococcales bacterium]|nr:MAG: ATP-dependent Clp protease ATP-binding subunit ClpA [Myxococcales bacterium]
MLSHEVEKIVEKALKEAKMRHHEFATVEHLCFVLFESPKIKVLLQQIGVSKKDLRAGFLEFLEHQIDILPENSEVETLPSLGLQRVLQRAAVNIAGAGKSEVSVEHLLIAAFDEDESYAVFLMQQAGISRLDLVSVISHGAVDIEPGEDLDEIDEENSDDDIQGQKKTKLSLYTLCLTEEARRGKLDQLIGREKELERVIQVLSRRKKNNPLLVGDPGVGKTALAEGLASKIVEAKVPEYLKGAEVYLLDMGALLAGARYRGDFENRMKAVLKALEKKPNAIMVIDEIHTVIGAGSTTGSSMDASNLLKPILSKGHLRCIGSTTYREYRSYFEKDRALARRFQKIDIDEPTHQECEQILHGIKKRYEEFHQVKITDEALGAAVALSARFLHERKLPDKAIDLIDEACARLRLANSQNQSKKKLINIDLKAIEDAVASIAQIPSRTVNQDDKDLLKRLEASLKSNVYGQDEAIEKISDAILMSRAGLRERDKPIGSFLFSGPSGVGKTEVAKQLAQSLGVSLIRFDMSEYMERHTASRLVGAPPGYVGYEQGGLLTDAINKTPYAVLLLDEIEKAHPDVFNMLLQVMDYGKLTDNNGRSSDFRHVILIMTSNVGARQREQHSIGFFEEDAKKQDDKAIKLLFSPEFRNRLDATIPFAKLSVATVKRIVGKFISELEQQLKEKNVTITLSENATDYLAQKGYDPAMGARPLARIIQEQIKKPLAKELLFGNLSEGGKVHVEVIDGTLTLTF